MKQLLSTIVACGVLIIAVAVLCVPSFDEFAKKYNKKYTQAEYGFRRHVYNANIQLMSAHNQHVNGTHQMGVGPDADITLSEFHHKFATASKHMLHRVLAGKSLGTQREIKIELYKPKEGLSQKKELDYRKHEEQVLTPVKDQGMCNAGYAFAATEAIESKRAMDGYKLTDLSAQQLISCDADSKGCDHGVSEFALETAGYVGMVRESDLPYAEKNNKNRGVTPCKVKKLDPNAIVKVVKIFQVAGNNGQLMMKALNEVGPIISSVSIKGFEHYKDGVIQIPVSMFKELDHTVQIVGYTTEKGKNVWIIRNSMGTSWGDQGYGLIAREDSTECTRGPRGDVCGTNGIMSRVFFPGVESVQG